MSASPTKVELSSVYGKVTTLLDRCTNAVICNLSSTLIHIENLPANLKDKCLYLMTKRGLINDDNIDKVLHEKVKVLDLSESDVSDNGLTHLQKCPNLVKLDLNSTKQSRTNVTSQGICEVASKCPNLQTLYLRRCLNITDEAVIALSTHCPQIRYLNVGGCNQLTDNILISLGQHSKFLRSLNVANTKITDNGIFSLVSGPCGKTLKEIHINGCTKLTDEAVEAIVQFCPQISILLFHGCPNITEKSRLALEERGDKQTMKQVTWTIY